MQVLLKIEFKLRHLLAVVFQPFCFLSQFFYLLFFLQLDSPDLSILVFLELSELIFIILFECLDLLVSLLRQLPKLLIFLLNKRFKFVNLFLQLGIELRHLLMQTVLLSLVSISDIVTDTLFLLLELVLIKRLHLVEFLHVG